VSVLSVSKLSPGQEAYYERSVADGIDDYYAGRGESPGVWVGRGAAELELEGVVEEGELGRLIGGRHPVTSAVLRRHPPKKLISVETIDPVTGERWLEQKTLSPVAGYDLVFSPPKSVSLLHALGGEQVREAVNQAHLVAWQAALAYLEGEACVTRRGKNGVVRERGSGFVAAAYQHRTSRAQDPHLHTHVIVANLARSPDAVWRALDGEPILKHYRLAAGYLYQSQLRYELTRSLGVEWREPVDGMAEIAGVPEDVLRAFSRRREQVLDHLERQGSSGFYAAKIAALATRERKEPVDLPRLREHWQARAAEHGLGRRELKRLLGRAIARELDEHEVGEIAARLAGSGGLTEKQSTFSEAEAVMAWAHAHAAGAPPEQVLALARRFTGMDEVAPIRPAAVGRPALFSTADLLHQERAALRLAARSRDTRAPAVSAATIEQVTHERNESLGREQVAMLRTAASSPDRVVCVVGHAGAGKTTALAALAEAFQREGFVAIGAAPSGVAAAKLTEETGIPSGTLHRLLAETQGRGGLPRRCLLIVDEAGMADTRTLTRMLFQVEHAGGKAVLVGDPAQLPAVGAGGLFAAIIERNGAIELSDNRRQQEELERRALARLREGAGRDYLAQAAEQGRLIVAGNRIEAKAQLVADWWRAAREDPAGCMMIAYRRADVAELNAVARTLLDREGRLGRERLRLANGIELAAGDRVVCTRNDRRLGVANGTRGTVVDVDDKRQAIVLELDHQGRVELPAAYLDAGHVSHAYALTGHKTQGLTLEQAFVLATGRGQLKEWGYVALSRSRRPARLYTTAIELEPDAPPQRPEHDGPLDRLANAFTRPAAERLGIEAASGRSDRDRLAARMRALTDQRRRLEKQRMQTARQLHQTKAQVADLGALGRARHGRRLREQVTERREDLAILETELDRLECEQRALRARLRAMPRVERPRRGRELMRERPLQRGPELGL
jgi:conjugative relaxase-like TrwC/TraI family protein